MEPGDPAIADRNAHMICKSCRYSTLHYKPTRQCISEAECHTISGYAIYQNTNGLGPKCIEPFVCAGGKSSRTGSKCKCASRKRRECEHLPGGNSRGVCLSCKAGYVLAPGTTVTGQTNECITPTACINDRGGYPALGKCALGG